MPPLRNACTYCAAALDDKCRSLHTPCIDWAAGRAGRCCHLHTPCKPCRRLLSLWLLSLWLLSAKLLRLESILRFWGCKLARARTMSPHVFPEHQLVDAPPGMTTGMAVSCILADFGRDVGIKCVQHLGSTLDGKAGRKSAHGWAGFRRDGMHGRHMVLMPASPDDLWNNGFLSPKVGRKLLKDGSPARTRFENLLVTFPTGVPLTANSTSTVIAPPSLKTPPRR